MQTAGLGLAHQKFLEQQRVRADALCGVVRAQRQQFVAQRQQAARLQPDDRHAARGKRRVSRNQPIEFGAGLIDQAGRKKRPPAAQRPAAIRGLRQMHAIAALDQHAQRGVEIFALIGAVEGVGEQHDFAAVGRAERFGGGREHVAPPVGQGALRADAGKFFEQLSQQRTVVAQIGERREARRQRRIARQIADQPVAQRQPVLGGPRGQHLDLHLGHVDAGRAFVAAGLAGDAEFQRLHHLVGRQRIGSELAGNRQPQRVGAAARDVLLVAGGAIGRAHHAALELAAGAVVVAHLDRALEAAAGAGIGRPVERGLQFVDAIVRRIAKQRAIIHLAAHRRSCRG